jgi:hypothetical protein
VKLAKPRIDIGFSTNNAKPALDFWQNEIGLPFDHALKVRGGHLQHRHDPQGSILKINELEGPIPDRAESKKSSDAPATSIVKLGDRCPLPQSLSDWSVAMRAKQPAVAKPVSSSAIDNASALELARSDRPHLDCGERSLRRALGE